MSATPAVDNALRDFTRETGAVGARDNSGTAVKYCCRGGPRAGASRLLAIVPASVVRARQSAPMRLRTSQDSKCEQRDCEQPVRWQPDYGAALLSVC